MHAWGTLVTLFPSQTALIWESAGEKVRHADALMVFGRDGFWNFWRVVVSSKGVFAMIYLIGPGLVSGAIYALAPVIYTLS